MYEPFGYRLDNLSRLFELLGFTFIAFVFSMLFFWVLPYIYRKKFDSGIVWTVGSNCIYLSAFLFVTGLSIFLYDFHIVSGYSFSDYGGRYFMERIVVDVCGVFSIGVFPLYVSYLLEKNYYLKKDLDEIIYVSESSSNNKKDDCSDVNCITLKGDTKDSLEVCPERIVYIESSGNYVNVYYNDGVVERKTIRTAIKKIEEQLSDYSFFVRCHRAFIVNMNFVVKFGRNNLGYRICLDVCNEDIPVSRTYLSNVKDFMKR